MNRFHVCKKVKSFFLVVLSVAILVCSVPSFSIRSQALEATAGYLGSLAYSEYLALVSYLLSRGYSAPRIASDDSDYLVSSTRASGQAEQFLNSFLNKIKAFDATNYAYLKRALEKAGISGKLVLDENLDSFLQTYLSQSTVDSKCVLGNSTETFDVMEADSSFSFSYDWYYPNDNINVQAGQVTFTCDYDYLPLVVYSFNSLGGISQLKFYFIPLEPIDDVMIFASVEAAFTNTENINRQSSSSIELGGGLGRVATYTVGFNNDNYYMGAFRMASILTSAVALAESAVAIIARFFQQNGYYENSVDFTSTQVIDTTNTDVLSPASVVDPTTGEVTGGTTIYLPDISQLQETIDDFTNGVISWITAIKQLGLAQVSDDATVAQKETALDSVSIPDSTYLWITETTWGSTTISETVTNEMVDSQTKEGTIAEELAEQYSDNAPEEPSEEDKNKGGLAMLIATALLYLGLWNDPDTDPTNPDSGGIVGDPEDEETVPWLVDTLMAIPEVSGILGDMFSAAGGTNGYGFVYTVGISFVLFSVIIGAGHFFGALGSEIESRQMVKDAASVTDKGKSNNIRSSGRYRHKRVEKGA